jgi:hypothetical protein
MKATGWFTTVAVAVVALSVASCIRDEAPNPEADILAFAFPENSLRTAAVEIYNDLVVAYPRPHVSLRDSAVAHIELSPGATHQRIACLVAGDTLFYIDVTSESRQYTKRYAVTQVENFPEHFGFETWVRPTAGFLYENPRDGALQWYSSNNGVAIAWNSPGKAAHDYPVCKGTLSGSAAVELRTMEGPGNIAGAMYIPCIAGSVFLGGFNALTGLTNPLRSTLFGVPFNSGKPLKLTGYYLYTEGASDYILPDGSRDRTRKDRCDIYAVLFRTDEQEQFLYGDNIGNSPQIIARAKIRDEDIRTNEVTFFELDFDYDSFPMPFSWEELKNDRYKITIVCSSSSRGQFYEGCPGNTLTVDNLNLSYDISGL